LNNSFQSRLAALIEISMNRLIPFDPMLKSKIKEISGSVIALYITDWNTELFFLPDDHQFIVLTEYNGKPDVMLKGDSWDFFRMGINKQTKRGSSNSKIHFEGDIAIGQSFELFFTNINIDWESSLSGIMGENIANHATTVVKQAGQWLQHLINDTHENINQYTHDHLDLTPDKSELDTFYSDVTQLSEDAEILECRFYKLQQNQDRLTE
jgi:ubiquinone biosynthesis protein UbiJ